MKSTINNNIKSIRELKNYTQQHMARQLGITQAGYSKIEKGQTSMSLEKLEHLSVILELPLEIIMNFDSKSYFNQNRIIEKGHAVISEKTFELVTRLYEDKIIVLEKLLGKTNQEFQSYKEKYALL